MATPPPPRSRGPTVMTTLADVFCYQASEVEPARAHRRSFPAALKRLRDRLRALEERLVLDANALRQDVANLELQRRLLTRKISAHDARVQQRVVAVVGEYFSVFERGWLQQDREINAPHEQIPRGRGDLPHLPADAVLADRQRRFLRTAVAREVLDQLTACWQSLAREYEGIRLVLTGVECVGAAEEPIVVARAIIVGSLRLVGGGREPHRRHGRDADASWGEPVEYPCRVTCSVTSSGQICGHTVEIDRVDALRRAMGSLERVEEVLRLAPGR